MKRFIIKLINWFLKRLYPFLDEAQRQFNQSRKDSLIKTLKKYGNNIKIRGDYTIYGTKHIEIDDDCELGLDICIQAFDSFNNQSFKPELVIGKRVLIGDNCHIGCVNRIVIGDNSLIARRVCIIDHLHGRIDHTDLLKTPIERELINKPIVIGRNVWIGEGACILPGVELGDNVIVGANAVVTHSFERNSVIAGVPAKIIKTL